MRYFTTLLLALSFFRPSLRAEPPQAPLPPQAPELSARAALALAAATVRSGCDCVACDCTAGQCGDPSCPAKTSPLEVLAASLSVATQQPAQAPVDRMAPSVDTLPSGVYVGLVHQLPDDGSGTPKYHLSGGAFKADGQGKPPVTSQGTLIWPAQQAGYLARGWTFADGYGAGACVPVSGAPYQTTYFMSGDGSGGCANGSCGSSGRGRGRRR